MMNTQAMLGYLHNQLGVSPDALELKRDLLWWQKQGLQYTASGYGKAIPTQYKVRAWNRWYRVYCCIYGNIGTCYIKTTNGNFYLPDSLGVPT